MDTKDNVRRLNGIVARLDQSIKELQEIGYGETVALLQMVRLDLFSRMHGISADELDALLFVARSEHEIAGNAVPPLKPKRRPAAVRAR